MDERTLLLNVLKVFGLSAASFFIAFLFAPLLTHYLYKYKLWVKKHDRKDLHNKEAPVVAELTKNRGAINTPYMGGILVWGTTLALALLFFALSGMFDGTVLQKINFLSRNQTWLPLTALVAASLVGFADDWFTVTSKDGSRGKGLNFKTRAGIVLCIGLVGALWFYGPLETDSVRVPFVGDVKLGVLFIPFFMLVMLAVFAGGVIDGLDGLAGGVFASIIAAYGGIAYFQAQLDLAAFLGVMGGALLAFLWFNIPPARFYMGETGMLGLTTTLTIVAFLTEAVAVLPIIAFPLVLEVASNIVQIFSKKFRGKKTFLAAPIHHHLEAIGWPHYKITMRFWVVSVVAALTGMVIHIVGN
ncbi:MAG: hypothetical protein HY470_01795 [Candidatus Ryanbacteria bacterium]|nr:hypothetical protein [Candidatus Ryanbacteria bacterium]